MPRSLARLSASESSHRDLSSAVFITNIAESDFRYTQLWRSQTVTPFALAALKFCPFLLGGLGASLAHLGMRFFNWCGGMAPNERAGRSPAICKCVFTIC